MEVNTMQKGPTGGSTAHRESSPLIASNNGEIERSSPLIASNNGESDVKSERKFNITTYSHTKTAAHGLTDFALMTRNFTLIRQLLLSGPKNDNFFYLLITFALLSVLFQIINGVVVFLSLRKDMQDEAHREEAHRLSKINGLLAFVITVINVTISAFEGHNLQNS
ncbi:ninjurin-2-like [Glandiceps talaboti]